MAYDATFSRVELSVRCTDLVNLDRFSKSDPMCVLFSKRQGVWIEDGRTEVIRDNLNPKFVKTFVLPYHFEEEQPVRVAVYDIDSSSRDLKQHDFIGQAEFSVANVIVAGKEFVMNLIKPGDSKLRGKVHVIAEEVEESKTNIEFIIRGSHLDKKDFFGKSDPYVEISRGLEDGSFILVFRSEVIKNSLNPRWKPFTISGQKLCNGDYDRPLKFTVWDWDKNDTPDLIGHATSSLRALVGDEKAGLEPIAALELIEPAIRAKKGRKYKNSGILQFLKCKSIVVPTFVDYIRGGCAMSLMVAVDFTASNGDPRLSSSLHYSHPYQPNEYVNAIQSVGTVLAPYDTDQRFPAWGFGAKVPPLSKTSHCFPLNGNESDPEVYGVQGILDAYMYSLRQIQLHGPTIFSQVLSSSIQQVRKNFITQKNQQYHILLIITDGVINDMQDAVDRIVEASDLPLSIVIVGVGGADFKMMHHLDADDNPLRSRSGKLMSRDIVQFVPFREFTSQAAAFSLAREVLAEIPGQVTSFMKSKGFTPNPPRLQPSATVGHPPQNHFSNGPPPHHSAQGQTPYPAFPQYPTSLPPTAPYPTASGPSVPYPSTSGSTAPYPTASGPSVPYPSTSGPTAPPYPTGH
ncbi:copine-9-like [Corticium candelabrum]|uniref:copine-9-like n=1 Tax=Corticium candelabrum TaxID=121492 RepID=UPI002E25CE21|nr:copine-9-like [Corticium candelabrum]